MPIASKSIHEFLNDIARKPHTPAGGCTAALCAASAAALMEMVARHTIRNKDKSKNVIAGMEEIAEIASKYRKRFLDYMDIDTKAYKDVIQAQKNKEAHMDHYYKSSVNIPLEMVDQLLDLIHMLKKVVKDGSDALLTDGVAALLMAEATLVSLIYHVRFNLIYIKDQDFVTEVTEKIQAIEGGLK